MQKFSKYQRISSLTKVRRALVITAEMAAANGINLYDAENGALHRLADATMDGIYDPSILSARVGAAQVRIATLDRQDMAWLTVYNSRFPAEFGKPWLRTNFEPRSRMLGGDLELLYRNSNGRRG